MRSFFTWIARILAGIFAGLFVISLLTALLLVNAETRLFKAETYKQALISQNLYERMPKLLAEQIISNLTNNPCKDQALLCLSEQPSLLRTCLEQKLGTDAVTQLSTGERTPTSEETSVIENCTNEFGPIPNPVAPATPGYLKYLTVQDWEILINTLVPPEQMKSISEQMLDSLFNFLNGNTDNAVISLLPIKQSLSKNGIVVVQRVLSAQPTCTSEELLNLGAQFSTGVQGNQLKLCNPPQELISASLPIIETGLQTQINTIPNEVPLFGQNQQEVHMVLGTARMMMRLSPLLPLIFLLLMTLLVVRTLLDWLKWWGFPLVIAGGLTMAIALTAEPITQIALTMAAQKYSSVYALRLATTVTDVITAIARQVVDPVIIEAGIILLIGIGMLIGARLVSKKKTTEA